MALIDSGEWSFFVERPAGDRVRVVVRPGAGGRYLTTDPDADPVNNLDNLPEDPNPLRNTLPQWPLSQIGPLQPRLRSVEGPAENQSPGRRPIPAWNDGVYRFPRIGGRGMAYAWLTFDVPFFGAPEVYVDFDDTAGAPYNAATHKLQRLSDGPLNYYELENAGLGWWNWTVLVPDASYPRRFTPAEFYVRFPRSARMTGCQVILRVVAGNEFCRGRSDAAVVRCEPVQAPARNYGWVPTAGSGTGGSGNGPGMPPRRYGTGAFTRFSPGVFDIGDSSTSADGAVRADVVNAADRGMPAGALVEFTTTATGRDACKAIPFDIALGTLRGGGFTPVPPQSSHGIVIGGAGPGSSAEATVKVARLGAATSEAVTIDCNLSRTTTPIGSPILTVLVSPDSQVFLVVDVNRFGGPTFGRARLFDMNDRARQIGVDIETTALDTIAAQVVAADGGFAVRVTDAAPAANRVDVTHPLPSR